MSMPFSITADFPPLGRRVDHGVLTHALSMLVVMFSLSVSADTEIVNGIEWRYASNGSASIVGASSEQAFRWPTLYTTNAVPIATSGDIVVPDRLGGCPVTIINRNAFMNCSNITSIAMSDTVTNIYDYAFCECVSLRTVKLSERLEWMGEDSTFYRCGSLQGLSFPAGFKGFFFYQLGQQPIGARIFRECPNLKYIVFKSNAPVQAFGVSSFDSGDTPVIYVPEGSTGWTAAYSTLLPTKWPEGNTYTAKPITHWEEVNFVVDIIENEFTYSGARCCPSVIVRDGDVALGDGIDYTVTYADNVDAGTAKVIIETVPPRVGERTCEFTIAPRCVTLTSGSASKVYDGFALVKHTVTVGGMGFASGEGVVCSYAGSQTMVGSSANAFAYTLNDGTKASNYTITKSEGTLNVTPASVSGEPGAGEVPDGGLSKFDVVFIYDGQGHTIDTNALNSAFGTAIAGPYTLTYALSQNGSMSMPTSGWGAVVPTCTNVGEHVIWYKMASPNYAEFSHAVKVTIKPKLVFDYDGGRYVEGRLSISGVEEGWTIYYTTNGSAPTVESTEYTAPFVLSAPMTVQALAVSETGLMSDVYESSYNLIERDGIKDMRARQRYPWNGLVDMSFTVTGLDELMYDISFVAKDLVGNTNIIMATIYKSDGTLAATPEQLSRGKYNWVWNADADLPQDAIYERMIVIGTCEVHVFSYSVKFNANGGTGAMPDESFTYGVAKELTENVFTRTGYSFQGWATSTYGSKAYNDKQAVSNLTTTADGTVNLYANWKGNSYSVKFNANGGTGTMPNESLTYGTASALAANAFTRTGYAFQGWSTSAGGAKVYDDNQVVSNLTTTADGIVNLYANWKGNSYTVKFNANGGTGTMPNEPFSYGAAKALTANAFTRAGHTFQGWAMSTGGTKVYDDNQVVSNLTSTADGTVNLYAVWVDKVYMVADLSSGAISYLSEAPSGVWPNEYKDNKLVLRRVDAGSYYMGSPAGEEGRANDEQRHSVTLTKPFYVGIFEVTQGQWYRLMGTKPSNFPYNPYRPVEKVSYSMIRGSANGAQWPSSKSVDASSFLGKLRSKVNKEFDLPTEAQWEYACRAGSTAAFNNGMEIKASSELYSGHTSNEWLDSNIAESAIYWGDGVYIYFKNWSFGAVFNGMDHAGSWEMAQQYNNATLPVGMLRPNSWGLYDMHGNVCEWCLDWVHASNGLGYSAVTDPVGLSTGSYRVVRSGSWHSPTFECRAAFRGTTYTPSTQNYMIGFRVVCPSN